MSKKLKAAVWGPGFIGERHLETLNEIGVEPALICGTNEKRLKALAEKYHVSDITLNGDDVVNSGLDCVHLCTPPGLHYDQMKRLLAKKINVLCEKPLCFENEEARELYELARKNNCLAALGFNVRFHGAVKAAKSTAADPSFGGVRLIHGSYLQEFHALPAPSGWRYDKTLAGPMRAMTEIGSHWTDLAQFISGKKIQAVSARFANFSPERDLKDGMMFERGSIPGAEKIKTESEDCAVLNFLFEDGVIGSCVLSEVSQGRINRLEIEITGSKKNIWWNSEDNNVLHSGEKDGGITTRRYPFGNGFADTLRELCKAFYADIRRGAADEAPSYPTLYDGMVNVFICNAARESAAKGGAWVEIAKA